MRPTGWRPTTSDRERLLAFEGYGPDRSDVIFVGLEEYCDADPEKQRDGVWVRCTSPAYASKRVDKDEALASLVGLVKTDVPVWDMMATIMSGLTGRSHEEERSALGSRPPRTDFSSWLTELRALPRPGTNAFKGTYIDEWFAEEFRSAKEYDASSSASVSRINAALAADPLPQYAFFYGLPACRWAKEHLSGVRWKGSAGEIEVGQNGTGTKVGLTGFYNGQHAPTSFRIHHVPALLGLLKDCD